MLRPRIIPALLLESGRLVKTRQFSQPTYLGDPLNAARIFSELYADELLVLDISATANGREPDYDLVEKVASETQMPVCYGGGISTSEIASKVLRTGVEKVSLSSAALVEPEIVSELADKFGSQSVVVTIDVRCGSNGDYEVCANRGRKTHELDPVKYAQKIQEAGAGEIVINNVDRDGMMKGYDQILIRKVKEVLSVPLVALGGSGKLEDFRDLFKACGLIACAAGSQFVYEKSSGAVLISYPDEAVKARLIGDGSSDLGVRS